MKNILFSLGIFVMNRHLHFWCIHFEGMKLLRLINAHKNKPNFFLYSSGEHTLNWNIDNWVRARNSLLLIRQQSQECGYGFRLNGTERIFNFWGVSQLFFDLPTLPSFSVLQHLSFLRKASIFFLLQCQSKDVGWCCGSCETSASIILSLSFSAHAVKRKYSEMNR